MQTLEARHLLDRAVEFLPDDMELAERRNRAQPLTRPELAVLLAYAKLALQGRSSKFRRSRRSLSRRANSSAISRRRSRSDSPMQSRTHRLRREIIATQLTNSMINRGGPSLIARIADATGAAPDRIAAAFAAVRDGFRADVAQRRDRRARQQDRTASLQLSLYAELQNLLLDRMVWFLRHVDLDAGPGRRSSRTIAPTSTRSHWRSIACCPKISLPRAWRGSSACRRPVFRPRSRIGSPICARLRRQPTSRWSPPASANRWSMWRRPTSRPVRSSASTASSRPRARSGSSDYFDRLALDRALDQIGDALRRLTADMMNAGAPGPEAVERWVAAHAQDVERTRHGRARNRSLGADAFEARGGREHAGRSGAGVTGCLVAGWLAERNPSLAAAKQKRWVSQELNRSYAPQCRK